MPKGAVPYAKGFHPPTPEECQNALGEFPFTFAVADRAKHQPAPGVGGGAWRRPSASPGGDGLDPQLREVDDKRLFTEPTYPPEDVDEKKPARKKKLATKLWPGLPPPQDDLDWLASYAEEGQTFKQFIETVCTRSGRFKSSHFGGGDGFSDITERQTIGLVPIIRASRSSSSSSPPPPWPSHGPPLAACRAYCEAYFDRPVKILPPATVALPAPRSAAAPGAFKPSVVWRHAASGQRRQVTHVRVAPPGAGPAPTSPAASHRGGGAAAGFEPRLQVKACPAGL